MDHFVIPHNHPSLTVLHHHLSSFTVSFIFLRSRRTTKPYFSLNCERACVLENLASLSFYWKLAWILTSCNGTVCFSSPCATSSLFLCKTSARRKIYGDIWISSCKDSLLINMSFQFGERLIVCCEKHDKKYTCMHKYLTGKLFIKIYFENLFHY